MVIAEDVEDLPDEAAISVVTLAELHFGVHLARTEDARRGRLRRLSEVETRFDALPVEPAVARAYGALAGAEASAGRRPRTRAMDLLIAATAQANGVPLYTRDPDDFEVAATVIDVRVV